MTYIHTDTHTESERARQTDRHRKTGERGREKRKGDRETYHVGAGVGGQNPGRGKKGHSHMT